MQSVPGDVTLYAQALHSQRGIFQCSERRLLATAYVMILLFRDVIGIVALGAALFPTEK